MRANELVALLRGGALKEHASIYSDLDAASERIIAAVEGFAERFGAERDIYVFSVPGRSEVVGNHTDHNNGRVLAAAIDRDVIAVAAKNTDMTVRFNSEGYAPDTVNVLDTYTTDNFEKYTSSALIAGVINGFENRGYAVGGFDCYSTSEVLKGSGISSSAAYEVMIGNILNHLYNGGRIENRELAHIAQYAENRYFGKPCGLMDQMACAVGGFVFIDFAVPSAPTVEPIGFSLRDAGYSLCIVNTGGNHADLNEDYASVPREMRAVASALGREVLSGITEDELIAKIPELRVTLGDRAILRALHFIRENKRVDAAVAALERGSVSDFFAVVRASGRSSFEYLQNVYTNVNIKEQGLSLALALTDGFLDGQGITADSALRVHGGGFAGTVQVFLPSERLSQYAEYIEGVFGKGAALALNVRPVGACRLF